MWNDVKMECVIFFLSFSVGLKITSEIISFVYCLNLCLTFLAHLSKSSG